MAPWSPSRAGAPGPVTGREALARQGYAFHGAELYRAALSWLGDDASVQDAVQETIVRAWRAAERFDPARGSLRTWLYAILRNVVRDQYLARQRRPVPVDTQEHPEGGPRMSDRAMAPHRAQAPDPSDLVADTDLVTRALGQVSPDHRTAIVETFLRDRPYDDVAAELGVSVSTLRSQGPATIARGRAEGDVHELYGTAPYAGARGSFPPARLAAPTFRPARLPRRAPDPRRVHER